MDRLNPWRCGGATALTAAILSVLCAVAVYLFPQGTLEFVNSWTHGLDLTALRSERAWTVGGVALGVFNVSLTGFVVGVVFAWCYNLVGKCGCCPGCKGGKHGD